MSDLGNHFEAMLKVFAWLAISVAILALASGLLIGYFLS